MKKNDNINNEYKWVYNFILPLSIIISVFTLFGLVGYFRNFYGTWSKESADYGDFGSFWGGLISPIIALITSFIVFLTN